MRALTLHQPYAQLVRDGRKTDATRAWAPPANLVGQMFAVHASMNHDAGNMDLASMWGYKSPRLNLPYGAVVAVAKLLGSWQCKPDSDYSTRPGYEYGDYSPGRWVWVLQDVRPLRNAWHCRGSQRLWVLADDTVERILEELM